jgi:hypothetical protein
LDSQYFYRPTTQTLCQFGKLSWAAWDTLAQTKPETQMSFFSQDNQPSRLAAEAGSSEDSTGLQHLQQRLTDLHQALYPRFKKQDLDLHSDPNSPGGVGQKSATTPTETTAMTLIYMRPDSDAKIVESMMGRDALSMADNINIESHRHPVIELRITPDYFTVELIVSPDAWYDQQNLIGKLSVKNHRDNLHQLFSELDEDYLLGFWHGVHLDDTHLNTSKLPPPRIFTEYLETFADRRDCLRAGHWYTLEDSMLQADHIVDEVFDRVQELYRLYTFIAWSNKNNFQSLYKKSLDHSKR